PADGESRVSSRAPDDGAAAIELVSALRPESANLRAEHFLGEAGRLSEGDAAHLSRPRTGELHRAPAREGGTMIRAAFALLTFVLSALAPITQTPPQLVRHEFVIRDFRTESGAVLPEARIVYTTVGSLNAAR